MSDLKAQVKSKLFGGKVRFHSDEQKQEEAPLQVRDSNESVEGNEPQPEN